MDIRLENVLKYEQPTKYIVKSENYSDDFALPVLTAGKSFVLGYTDETEGVCKASENPVIIFDDFTADCKYVDFDFKVKSSAMKILHKANAEDNLKYYFYAIQAIEYTPFSHKRVWISEYSKFKIENRSAEEQNNIVKDLDTVATAIDNAKQRLNSLDELIKSRFIEMFVNQEFPVVSLDSIAEVTGGLTKNGKRKDMPMKYPYLRVANVYYNHLDLSEILEIGVKDNAELEKTLLKTDDLLFVEGNGSPEQIGRVALWNGSIAPCLHQNHLIKARLDFSKVNPRYVLFYFMSEDGREQIANRAVSTSGLYTLSVSKVAGLVLPIPPIVLQNEFAEYVKLTDKSKFIVQKQIEDLQELLDSKMDEYFG